HGDRRHPGRPRQLSCAEATILRNRLEPIANAHTTLPAKCRCLESIPQSADVAEPAEGFSARLGSGCSPLYQVGDARLDEAGQLRIGVSSRAIGCMKRQSQQPADAGANSEYAHRRYPWAERDASTPVSALAYSVSRLASARRCARPFRVNR